METRFIPQMQRFSPEKMSKIGLFDTEHFFCDIYCFESGQVQKLHSHEGADKVYFVLRGEGVFQVGEEREAHGEGSAILAPAGQPHGVENRSGQQLVLLVFMSPNPNRK